MAFTAPRTWVSGEIVTAANMNTHVRDNMKAAAGADKASCRVYSLVAQTITNSTVTQINCELEQTDTQAMHDNVTNNSRITIPTGWGGIYLIGAQVNWAGNSTGVRVTWIRFTASNDLVMSVGPNSTSVQNDGVPVTTLNALTAGDYVQATVWQNSGGNLNTALVTGASPMFWAMWMGTG